MTKGRIGFACKWIDNINQVDGIKSDDACRPLNTYTTTKAWLSRQTQADARDKLDSIVLKNLNGLMSMVLQVSKLQPDRRMLRISSDILPMYTEPTFGKFYQDNAVRQWISEMFRDIGDVARTHDIRLSFHPGQFTVLASDNPEIVDKSIQEFEYHVDMARWMGYGQSFQDFKINVHISGKRGPQGIRDALKRMSPEARNCITIENDENSWGIEHSLELANDCALVLDIHHHWVRDGEHIMPDDERIKRIQDSWRGVRPVIHYSMYKRNFHEYAGEQYRDTKWTMAPRDTIIEGGVARGKLRAHSAFFWHEGCNEWALSHGEWADIMCESKGKNIAAADLLHQRDVHKFTERDC